MRERKKVTFHRDEALPAKLKGVPKQRKKIRPKNFVEETIRQYASPERRRHRALELEEASRDPLFLADLEEINRAFEPALMDGLENEDAWEE